MHQCFSLDWCMSCNATLGYMDPTQSYCGSKRFRGALNWMGTPFLKLLQFTVVAFSWFSSHSLVTTYKHSHLHLACAAAVLKFQTCIELNGDTFRTQNYYETILFSSLSMVTDFLLLRHESVKFAPLYMDIVLRHVMLLERSVSMPNWDWTWVLYWILSLTQLKATTSCHYQVFPSTSLLKYCLDFHLPPCTHCQ